MKKLFLSLLLVTQVFMASSAHASRVNEADFDFRNTFGDFQEGITEVSEDQEEGVEGIVLPTYQEDDPFTEGQNGVGGIVKALRTLLDILKIVVAPIAVLLITIMGVRMVTAGKENEDVTTKSKNFIAYAIEALLVIFVADQVVNVFFGAEGDIFRFGEAGAAEFGRRAGTFFEGIFILVQAIISTIAVAMLISAGFRYFAGSFSEDELGKAKRQITWSLVGLFIIAISEFVVKRIIFRDQGQRFGVAEANELFAQVTNFIAGTMGSLSFVFLLYAGYLYVTSAGNEDSVSKSKKIIMGAIIGLVLAGAAFALSTTITELDASR